MLNWSIEKLTSSTAVPVSVATLKTNLRLPEDCGTQDALLASKSRAAGEQIEYDTGQALLLATFQQNQDFMPIGSSPLQVQIRPLASVSLFEYDDDNGDTQALVEGVDFEVETARQLLTPVGEWPSGSNLRLQVVAGYGYDEDDLPAWAVEAILLQAGHWHIDPAMEVAENFASDKAYERIVHRRIDPTYPVK